MCTCIYDIMHATLISLFLSLAMTKPDRQLIAQVMLYSQGFRTAEVLATKIVPFFKYVHTHTHTHGHTVIIIVYSPSPQAV